MKVSYILPHNNREELLEQNLFSLSLQTNKNFEVIITDSTKDKNKISEIYKKFKDKLDIKLFYVDNKKCVYSNKNQIFFNPAVQQNVGVKQSQGDVIILTSPEVINATTNVENFINFFSKEENKNKFCYGWVDECDLSRVEDKIIKGITSTEIKEILKVPSGPEGAKCRVESWRPANYFLSGMLKENFLRIGGIEEKFMGGIAYEDDEFSARCIKNKIEPTLFEDVAGIHLSHSRQYHRDPVLCYHNQYLFMNLNNYVANLENTEWGSEKYIINKFEE